jgi:hypothetical protein
LKLIKDESPLLKEIESGISIRQDGLKNLFFIENLIPASFQVVEKVWAQSQVPDKKSKRSQKSR